MKLSKNKSLITLFVLSSLFLLFFAAKPKTAQHLYGKWKYCSGSGGFTGKGPAWNAADNIYFEFKKNGKFKKTENKKNVENDSFKIEVLKSSEQKTDAFKLVFSMRPSMLAVITGDTLYLNEDVADGFSYVFARNK